MQSNTKFKRSYTFIFIFFYLIEGFVQGIPILVFPPYLTKVLGGSYSIPLWIIVMSIGNLPWAIKMIVGLFNDKWGSKKFGRRFPWIISFGVFCAIWWFILAIFLPTDNTIYSVLALYYFMIMLGMAFADTALDGLILDIVPKEKLARVQGYTWAMLLLGMGAGGMLLGLIFIGLNLESFLFILTGILVLISCAIPYFIKEDRIGVKEIEAKEWNKDLLSVITKKKNWKLFIYSFAGAIQAVTLLEFFKYVILIAIGAISVDETMLSLQGGTSPTAYLAWSSIFYLFNGVGVVIGSIIAGKLGDKSRKKTVTIFYLIYIPFSLASIVPFIFVFGLIPGLIFGLLGITIFGILQGALVVANQTIRGDISKNYYPNLKSTFYALLISFANGGQNVGTIIGAAILSALALLSINYNIIYFVISACCALSLLISFLIFRTIDPKDYEFSHLYENIEDNK